MSIFSKGGLFDKIGRTVGDVARTVTNPLNAPTAAKNIINRFGGGPSPVAKVPIPGGMTALPVPAPNYGPSNGIPQYQPNQASVGGGVAAGITSFAACLASGRSVAQCAALGFTAGAGTALVPSGGGCGCHGSGRDPCTHNRLSSRNNPAPKATLFGGCCPPGRVLRRLPMGRDICIKQPRMNPFNPHALARADRRITTFARRAGPILHDMGYTVSRTRHVAVKTTRKRRRR